MQERPDGVMASETGHAGAAARRRERIAKLGHLLPPRAVPFPEVTQGGVSETVAGRGAAEATEEEESGVGNVERAHRGVRAWARARHVHLGPDGAVPEPRVAEIVNAVRTPEEHDLLANCRRGGKNRGRRSGSGGCDRAPGAGAVVPGPHVPERRRPVR